MIKDKDILEAFAKAINAICKMNNVLNEHNKMLLDLYERIHKLEEAE